MPDEQLAASVQSVVERDIEFGHAYGVLGARCTPVAGDYSCTVDIHAIPDAIQLDFDVDVAKDGCWVATRVGLNRAGGLAHEQADLPPETLSGCVE